jgi:hypothetical protein
MACSCFAQNLLKINKPFFLSIATCHLDLLKTKPIKDTSHLGQCLSSGSSESHQERVTSRLINNSLYLNDSLNSFIEEYQRKFILRRLIIVIHGFLKMFLDNINTDNLSINGSVFFLVLSLDCQRDYISPNKTIMKHGIFKVKSSY